MVAKLPHREAADRRWKMAAGMLPQQIMYLLRDCFLPIILSRLDYRRPHAEKSIVLTWQCMYVLQMANSHKILVRPKFFYQILRLHR